MVTSLLDRSEVIIQTLKEGNGKRTFALSLIVAHGIQTPKIKPTKSAATRLSCYSYAFELTFPPFVEPSQHDESPIPGPIQASDSQLPSHENNLTCETEPEVASMQSSDEIFACPSTSCSFIIDNKPVRNPPLPPSLFPKSPPAPSSPHFKNEALQEFTNLQPTLMIP
ncbi:hypothetical protein O181_010594 [Austropuccinia psidii MF-1]|uniref:Uncharacterized protein n=1 Tax=Austropuccinia psidii MF-1 TaxID=1389203 RepID=A0A9Q3BRC6_9BASI|nr:hypothetical protein [Austropuccinia psidii MF-1]